jgi:hypothetical protein
MQLSCRGVKYEYRPPVIKIISSNATYYSQASNLESVSP